MLSRKHVPYLLLLSPAIHAISYNFVSRPDLHPAPWNITFLAKNAKLSDGYVFLAPAVGQTGLMIYDNHGEVVYCNNDNETTQDANNFRVQKFNGEDFLTYWSGPSSGQGVGAGFNIMLKDDYTIAHNFSAPGIARSDLHEFEIASNGNAVVTQYPIVNFDTSSLPGGLTNSFVFDGCFHELDIKSGTSRFTFCSLEHGISIHESFLPFLASPNSSATAWDYIHVNSVGKDVLGNYLLSGRHTHSLFYIDGRSGQILWRLGGKNSTFTGNGTDFEWQHHARFVGESYHDAAQVRKASKRRISLFDNHHANFGDTDAVQSRGLLLEIDLKSKTASIVQEYSSPGGEGNLLAPAEGSCQFLQDETFTKSTNVVVGYGFLPVFAEYAQDGTAQRVVHFGSNTTGQNYRTFKKHWVGRPKTPPDVILQSNTAFVSWNGATEVREWEVRQGDKSGYWKNVTRVPKTDFETAIPLKASQFIQLVALDKKRKVLGQSAIVKAK